MESDYVKDADSEFRTHLFDMFGVIEGMFRNREIAEILNESKPNMPWEYNHNLASRLRSLFARDLKEDGYLGFRTEEMTKGRISYRCYGIFDPEAFGSFFTVPIDRETARKALAALEDTEDDGEWKNYGKSNDIVREFAEEYRKVHGDGIAESLQIPPNFDDPVEMKLRKRLYGEEPEGTVPEKPAGMSDEKWAEIQKKSGEKNREKSREIFGMTNAENYRKLAGSYGPQESGRGMFQFFVSEDETLSEGLTIPPNPDDEIELELRRLLRPNEENVDTQIDPKDIPPAPEGKDPEKWREWQKASILKKREKEAQSKRDPFLEKWGDMLIGWYRNEKKSGRDKNYLR